MPRLMSPLLIASAVLFAPLTMAQDRVPQVQEGHVAEQWAEAVGPVISVEFAGGTVSSYIAALRAAAGKEPINVVVSSAAAGVTLAPIMLRGVNLDIALQAVDPAAGDAAGSFSIRRITPLVKGTTVNPGAPVYSVDFAPRPTYFGSRGPVGSTTPEPPPELAVFSLREMTEDPLSSGGGARVETVLTAVQAALELSTTKEAPPPELKYHSDSGLLILRATARQRAAVGDCIAALGMDVERRRRDLRESRVNPEEVIERRAMLTRAELEIQQHQAAMALAERNLSEVNVLVKSGNVPERELRQAQVEFQKHEAQLAAAKAESDRARQMLALIESRMAPNRLSGPVVADCSGWTPAQYDQAVKVLNAVFEGVKDGAKAVPLAEGKQTLAINGVGKQVEAAVGILREFSRVHGLAEPTIRPAGGDADPARP